MLIKNKVSVVIPTHNRNVMLLEAINSVRGQTYKNYEIIVVDDTNSESTQRIVNDIVDLPVSYVVNNEGCGAGSSRNLGARHAVGEYIAFLDDDDTWKAEKLEKQMQEFEKKTEISSVFSAIEICFPDLGLSYNTRPSIHSESLVDICIENYIGGTISCVMRKEVFHKLGGFDCKFPAREEYDLWIRLIASGYKITIVPDVLASANAGFIRKDRICSLLDNYKNAVNILNAKHKKMIISTLSKKQIKIRRSRQKALLGSQAVKIGDSVNARKYFFHSFFINPTPKGLIMLVVSLLKPKWQIYLRSKL